MMTIELTDNRIEIEMADSDELSLDEMFDQLEQMPVPEGWKAEIVEGAVVMSPQRDNHWDIILGIVEQLRTKYPRKRIKSDVRFDFPGGLNGFACDVVALRDGAEKDDKGRWRYQDVEFVAEVISRGTSHNDYGPKLDAYAVAEVPVYLIVDPYSQVASLRAAQGREVQDYLTLDFGAPVDLTGTAVGLTLETSDFDRR